jgi:quercetin dioxygenase-like cupin family protein
MSPPLQPPELIQLGQIQIRFLVDPAMVKQSLSMFEVGVAASAKVPAPHSHIAYDETIYGLEGTCTFTLSGQEFSVAPGDTLFIPRGAVHHFINRSAGAVRFLAVVTPGLLGPQYFRDLAEVARAGGPPDLKRIGEIMQRHGLKPAA